MEAPTSVCNTTFYAAQAYGNPNGSVLKNTALAMAQLTLWEHTKMIQKFPHRVSEVTPKGAELTPHD